MQKDRCSRKLLDYRDTAERATGDALVQFNNLKSFHRIYRKSNSKLLSRYVQFRRMITAITKCDGRRHSILTSRFLKIYERERSRIYAA